MLALYCYLIAAAIAMIAGLVYPLKNTPSGKPEMLLAAFYKNCDLSLFIMTMFLAIAFSWILALPLWVTIIWNEWGARKTAPSK